MTNFFKSKGSNFNMTFHFRPSASGELYKHLTSLQDEHARLNFLCSGQPNTATFKDQITGGIFFRPRIGGIIVSTSEIFKQYPTPTGAFKEAMRIKRAAEKQLKQYTEAINHSGITNRLIYTHFSRKAVAR